MEDTRAGAKATKEVEAMVATAVVDSVEDQGATAEVAEAGEVPEVDASVEGEGGVTMAVEQVS